MSISKILSYIGLGIVGAFLIVVIALSFVTTKLSITVSATKDLGSSVATMPDQITVSKYDASSSKEYSYKMFADDETNFLDYNSVLANFDALGEFSVMQKLFLGIGGSTPQIVAEKTKTFTALHKLENGFLVEYSWNEKQTLLNPDGSVYKNEDGNLVNFTKLAVFVDDTNQVSDYIVYVKTYTYDSSYSYYYYNITANVKSVYNLVNDFDKAGKLQYKLL